MIGKRPAAVPFAGERPDRAVIDIGSNTVRMVVYAGSARAPEVWLNERVSARLGRDLAATGALPDKAIDAALAALARYAAIVTDLGIREVQTVATAAVRDATNGSEFLARVRALGLTPRLLSGEEEAFGSAYGVIGAFPGAQGTVADLGGGSLELVMVEHGECRDGVSLPLGTLRLPALRAKGTAAFGRAVSREMGRAGWAAAHPGPLYMVGGTWRALAVFAMRAQRYPLSDPHGFCLPTKTVAVLAKRVARMKSEALAAMPGISTSRAAGLPDAAAMLRYMLHELEPDGVVFSSWGLREGLLYQRLGRDERGEDPLLAAVARFAGPRGGDLGLARSVAAWTAAGTLGTDESGERLRLAATMLALAAVHVEPNMRLRHAFEWAMDKRWVGLEPEGRARIAAALLASSGKVAPPPDLERLADRDKLREAVAWGLAIRVCRRLSAGSRAAIAASELTQRGGKLVLRLEPGRAQMISDQVTADLKALGHWLGLEPEVRVEEARREPRARTESVEA